MELLMTQNPALMEDIFPQETSRWLDKAGKLSLKFHDKVIQEVALSGGVVTIGRQPDNLLRIDNPIVSGHHARIFWENNHYVLEDNESFNATYLNDRRISRAVLSDGDIGDHAAVRIASAEEKVWAGDLLHWGRAGYCHDCGA
ncbi:MAG TPA: FHA domain-containing protein [Candidatus Sulfotelmatobacter sp.]